MDNRVSVQWGIRNPGTAMTFAQIFDSRLADNTPELVAALLIVGGVFYGIWRLVSKLQEGQRTIVDQFLGHIDKAEAKRLEAERIQQGVLVRVQRSLDENTRALGRSSSALERAIRVIEVLEHKEGVETRSEANPD